MPTYQRSFVNPLLALAFKEGIEFVDDPDYKALIPKKDGQNWIVLIEDNSDDEPSQIVNTTVAIEKQPTLRDFEDKLRKMTPITPQSLKITTASSDDVVELQPCGNCIPCKTGQDCMVIINAALVTMPMSRER